MTIGHPIGLLCWCPLQVHVHTESYLEQFGAESVVFLTAESPNVLQTLDPSKAYIIGGLVDHNHHKVGIKKYNEPLHKGHSEIRTLL